MKMKVCFIGGGAGHSASVFGSRCGELDYVGAAAYDGNDNLDKLIGRAAQLGHTIPVYNGWKEMLLEVKPDIAVVDTVFSGHAQVSGFALGRDINVYAEKPAATDLAQLDRLEKSVLESRGVYFSMLTARFTPCFYTAKMLTDNGAIGKIRMINAQKSYKLGQRAQFFKSRQSYGGTIPWVSIHMIDQILWVTGKKCLHIHALHSRGDNNGHGELETTAQVTMCLEGDILASVNTDYYRPQTAPTHGDDRIRIVGTEGVIEVRDEQVFLINRDNDGELPVSNEVPENIFDGFLRVIGGSRDPVYRDCGGLYSSRVALLARDAADRWL